MLQNVSLEADSNFMRRGSQIRRLGLLCALWCSALSATALACEGAQNIRLRHPVEPSAEELASFHAMAPLRVLAVDAPPMARYNKDNDSYTGVGMDVWCFITGKLGLRYELRSARDQTTASKIEQVQNGSADVFMPLSLLPERASRGLFTLPYYKSYYAVISHKDRKLSIHSLGDLAAYRVGVVKGVALDSRLQAIVPPDQLQRFDETTSTGLFQALQRGELDAAVFSKNIFEEKRYGNDYFDLEVVYTLRDEPREYRFYFNPSEQNQRLVKAFDRYLAAIDVSPSIAQHEEGERLLIERYVKQRSQRQLWQIVSVGSAVLMLIFGLAFLHYRRMVGLLTDRNRQILEQTQALEAANEKLKHLSLSDGLTGLANRRAFDAALLREHARHQRHGGALSVLMADLDRFKCVNDHYGHATGDECMRAVAQVLTQTTARATDIVARYGGEEFVCLLPDTGHDDAVALAERIREAVAQLSLPNALTETGHLTISIGIATLESGPATAQELLEQADAQLYAAKNQGRNQVQATVLQGRNLAPA